jgi:hypothetical protein
LTRCCRTLRRAWPRHAKDAAIAEAIQKKYSKDVPLEVVTDVVSDGTRDLPLARRSEWTGVRRRLLVCEGHRVSDRIRIQSSYLDDNDFKLYRSPTGLKVRTDRNQVTAGCRGAADLDSHDTWRMRTTVYAGDFDAVCCLAASIAFEQLAAKYTQTGDSMVNADTVNYRTKNQEYLALAKSMFKRYADHIGLNGDQGGGGTPQQAALSIGDMDNVMSTGTDRITHGRKTR